MGFLIIWGCLIACVLFVVIVFTTIVDKAVVFLSGHLMNLVPYDFISYDVVTRVPSFESWSSCHSLLVVCLVVEIQVIPKEIFIIFPLARITQTFL